MSCSGGGAKSLMDEGPASAAFHKVVRPSHQSGDFIRAIRNQGDLYPGVGQLLHPAAHLLDQFGSLAHQRIRTPQPEEMTTPILPPRDQVPSRGMCQHDGQTTIDCVPSQPDPTGPQAYWAKPTGFGSTVSAASLGIFTAGISDMICLMLAARSTMALEYIFGPNHPWQERIVSLDKLNLAYTEEKLLVGFVMDSRSMTICLLLRHQYKVLEYTHAENWLQAGKTATTIHDLESLFGFLSNAFQHYPWASIKARFTWLLYHVQDPPAKPLPIPFVFLSGFASHIALLCSITHLVSAPAWRSPFPPIFHSSHTTTPHAICDVNHHTVLPTTLSNLRAFLNMLPSKLTALLVASEPITHTTSTPSTACKLAEATPQLSGTKRERTITTLVDPDADPVSAFPLLTFPSHA
eukprot:jgi/Psemu1/13349/gm1.13349_g